MGAEVEYMQFLSTFGAGNTVNINVSTEFPIAAKFSTRGKLIFPPSTFTTFDPSLINHDP